MYIMGAIAALGSLAFSVWLFLSLRRFARKSERQSETPAPAVSQQQHQQQQRDDDMEAVAAAEGRERDASGVLEPLISHDADAE